MFIYDDGMLRNLYTTLLHHHVVAQKIKDNKTNTTNEHQLEILTVNL